MLSDKEEWDQGNWQFVQILSENLFEGKSVILDEIDTHLYIHKEMRFLFYFNRVKVLRMLNEVLYAIFVVLSCFFFFFFCFLNSRQPSQKRDTEESGKF